MVPERQNAENLEPITFLDCGIGYPFDRMIDRADCLFCTRSWCLAVFLVLYRSGIYMKVGSPEDNQLIRLTMIFSKGIDGEDSGMY